MTLIVLVWVGCSSSQVKPDMALPDLSTKPAAAVAEETAPAVEEKKPEERAPAAEKTEPEKPTGPICITRWHDLTLLEPLSGISNMSQVVDRGQATFSADADGKNYRLVNSGGGMSISTPDAGDHHITQVCKQPNGTIIASARAGFLPIDITIRPKSGKSYNIQFLNHNVDATVVE